ncbi:hypothetical protein [Sphingomonas sanxanigenens]|uniref:Uncharacterized protein n=1 Tax=Sphingomonas sanxanigenens DSM 19645 = NX02 TaxID=1123269 RepID=W0AHK6_9SPHN|nr:hypothetical protein [Sphingomonas sanxanigenens]AHE56591.1 hypothetical protein NX02_24920 [Sphingomonas sanxanigenens DSM 19645 = NX02]
MPKRRPPLSLENSGTYEARALEQEALAAATRLPHLKDKYLQAARSWLALATRARAVEQRRG